MSWKKILVLKDKFSYRQKVGMLLVAGVVCGLSGLFMYPRRHVQRLSCAPPELGIEVWFQGDGRTEAHGLFRDALRTSSSDGRGADRAGGDG